MNPKYTQSLKKIIDQFGKNVFKEPSKIQSLLMDFCKEYETENNLLILFVRAGITSEILESPKEILTLENLTHRYKSKLMNSYFLQESAVELGLSMILSALDLQSPQGYTSQASVNSPPYNPPTYISSPISSPISNPNEGGLPKVFTNSLGIKFQYIPDGEFIMGFSPGDSNGSDDEKPSHRVEITHPFYMGRYPVTQEQWTRVMGDKPFYFKNAGRTAPAESVSWNRVQEFLKQLNEMESRDGSRGKPLYRLPTEAEWEYAARAGTVTELYVGKLERNGYFESKPLDRIGWFAGNAIATYEGARETDEIAKINGMEYYKDAPNKKIGPQPVGKKGPNPWGLYDTIGNVWELCEDWYSDDYYGKSEIIDPKGPEKGEKKVVRGGSWSDAARLCRVSHRNYYVPDAEYSNIGFRLLLPLS